MNAYWRDRLNREAQKCYDNLSVGICKQVHEVNCGNANVEIIRDAYLALYDDHPELFYMSSSPKIAQKTIGFAGLARLSCESSVISTPIYSPKEIEACKLKIEQIRNLLRKTITPQQSDEEKIINVAEYIVRNTTYEIDNCFNQNAAAALCFGKAQCSGIAKAFKLLLDDLGIFCICVTGNAVDEKGEIGPHAWNIVRLSNNYYHVDVTFMLGANIEKKQDLVRICLFYDDEAMSKDHQWNKTDVPRCTDKQKRINDIENKKSNAQTNRLHSNECDSGNHYSSLNHFKAALREIINNKIEKTSFYLDIGLNNQSELANAVTNAFKMVAVKESASCSFTVSVLPSMLINIEITY